MLGLEDGRSYRDNADRVFEIPENQPTIFIRHGDGTAQGVVEMWLADRIHMLIEYPAVFKHYQSASELKERGFTSYPVEELKVYLKYSIETPFTFLNNTDHNLSPHALEIRPKIQCFISLAW